MATPVESQIADVQASIIAKGFSPALWAPADFGWDADEAEAAKEPFPEQMLSALRLFYFTFCTSVPNAWAHLAAEMQAGKTGVINAFVRLIFTNYKALNIRSQGIFITTGMNDNSWRKQTRERMPKVIRPNIHHNGGLAKVAGALRLLAAGGELKNAVVILDESHLAANYNNRPARCIYEEMHRLCPVEKWAANNVRLITISATDPSKVISAVGDQRARVVRLFTSSAYQSVESLSLAKRVLKADDFSTDAAALALKAEMERRFGPNAPLYHILRPSPRKHGVVTALLNRHFPGCTIVPWDAKAKAEEAASAKESDSSTAVMDDINELLAVEPEVPTFIILKNMFYASKTLDDRHVGVLYDRVSGKDDTNLQSLLGRACGYGKSKRSIIYTSNTTVTNYVRVWRDLITRCDPTGALVPTAEAPAAGSMPGVASQRTSGGMTRLTATAEKAVPTTAPSVTGAAAEAHKAQRAANNEGDRDHRVFATQEEAIRFAKDTLGRTLHKRKEAVAPKELLTQMGTNPSVETILRRFWGINEKTNNLLRMVPTDEGTWCVYWRPSLIAK